MYQKLAEINKFDINAICLDDEWEEVPLCSKQKLHMNLANMLNPRYILLENSSQMQHVFTSGTSGQCLEVCWLLEDTKKSLLPLWLKRMKQYGIVPQDCLCTFFSAKRYDKEPNWYIQTNREISFAKEDLYEKRMLEIYNKIVEADVKWMIVQPCLLELLYQVMKKYELPVWNSLAYIELTGEFLTNSFYKRMKKWFGVPIANQYGTHEVNTIAYGETTDYLDVVESNVYVEIVDTNGRVLQDGSEGEVCVTCFTNKAMPFVRYLVGDKGVMRTQDGKRQLRLTKARCMDFIYLEDGTMINPYIFQKAIEITNYYMDDEVCQFQFIQKGYNVMHVILVTEGGYEFGQVCRCITEHIYQKEMQDMHFEFEKREFLFGNDEKEKWGWFLSEI